ncbi:MAG TPA: glycosyltransferase family 4 protein [Solirubrobacteraceae bacterium]|nr:glycosyltransferase family 4 protein [Solirubrobacteraceae bacterium]
MSDGSDTSVTAADPSLKVLMIAPYFPFPPTAGAEMRTYQLLRQVASRHDVTLLSNAEAEDTPGIEALSAELPVRAIMRDEPPVRAKRLAQLRTLSSAMPFACRLLHSDQMQDALDELCAAEKFDLIHIESSTMACFRLPADIPVVVAEHNIEYELFRRLYESEPSFVHRQFYGWEYLRFRRFEQRSWRASQGCVLTSDREQPIVRAAAPDVATEVVPNGVDLDYFAPSQAPVEQRTVVFNGTLNYRPNLDGTTYLVNEIWPLVQARCPDATLSLVGNAPPEVMSMARPGIEVTGRVPDIRPYLQRATVVVAPLRIGAGTRLKIVEGMALGKAMVSTSIGCEGIDVSNEDQLLIGDDAPTFAEQIVRLFNDDELRARLGRSARVRAEEAYSWDRVGERLEVLYQTVLSHPGRRATTARDSTVTVR